MEVEIWCIMLWINIKTLGKSLVSYSAINIYIAQNWGSTLFMPSCFFFHGYSLLMCG